MGSFGENLRKERELRGVSLREISDATRISVRFLSALEADRLETLPGGLFPRAFVRQYARYVGLDEESIVLDFDTQHGVKAEPQIPTTVHHRSLPVGALFAAGVALVGLAIAVMGTRSDRATDEAVPQAAAAATPAPNPRPEEPQAPLPNDKIVLRLTAEQECWVRASADGRQLIDRVLQEGQSETVEATGEIVLSVGNAGGLSVRVNDRPAHPLGRSGEVKRNIMITPETATSMLEPGSEAPGPVGD